MEKTHIKILRFGIYVIMTLAMLLQGYIVYMNTQIELVPVENITTIK